MRFVFVLGLLLCLPGTSNGDDPRPWSPDQVTGKPDTLVAGDQRTAWAALEPDAGREWLKIEFEMAVEIAAVRIHETYNPGAISRVSAYTTPTAGKILWEGNAPLNQAPHVFEVKPEESVIADNITILFDTTRVSGWNEIDAVELLGKDGSRQWASKVTASTTYASRFPLEVLTYEALPPVVIASTPAAGTLDVDAIQTKEIRVMFSKEMRTDKDFNLIPVSKATFPELTGKIHFLDDKRTCVLPVKLEPNKTYVIPLNLASPYTFFDTTGQAPLPYQIVFRTQAAKSPAE